MTGIELINKGVCGAGSLAGYNMAKGCAISFKDVKEIWRTPADFEFDLTQDFDEDYIKSLQLAGKLQIIKNITDFPEAGTDNLIETLPDNTELDAGDAKYKYTPVWAQDLWLNVQLGKIEGQYNNRFVFVDSAGNILATEGSDENKMRGFLTSRTKRAKMTLQSPGVGAKQSLEFQLANSYELEDNVVLIAADLLDFDARLVESIVQAYVSFAVEPADTDTSVQVKVLVDRGRKDAVTGLTNSGDFKVLINGVEEAAAVASEASGIYTITTTALAASDKVEVSINGVKEVVGDALYVSNTAKKTVV
ncbi:hypothetical protein [Tenacibaculum phage JQ]|nr:hypothetical protein [Tenacibaculum phage JQ]